VGCTADSRNNDHVPPILVFKHYFLISLCDRPRSRQQHLLWEVTWRGAGKLRVLPSSVSRLWATVSCGAARHSICYSIPVSPNSEFSEAHAIIDIRPHPPQRMCRLSRNRWNTLADRYMAWLFGFVTEVGNTLSATVIESSIQRIPSALRYLSMMSSS
jgi:hypothetical protein